MGGGNVLRVTGRICFLQCPHDLRRFVAGGRPRAAGSARTAARARPSSRTSPTSREIDVNTIKAIERGEPGTIAKLEVYAGALGLSIVDVLSSVLKAAEQPPTPEAAALVRCFEHLGVVDRRLLLASAERLLEQHEARTRLEAQVAAAAATPAPTPGPRPTPPRTTQAAPAGAPSTPYAGSPVGSVAG